MKHNKLSSLLDRRYKFPSSWKIISSLWWGLAVAAIVLYCLMGILLAGEFLEVLLARDPNDQGDEIRNIGLVLAAFLGAPLVIWRSKIAFDQAQTAQERMITDRFSKAVDQLGAVRRVPRSQAATETDVRVSWEEEQPNIEVRLGGLYTLQRISEDSLPDHIRVIETLCAYVRLNSLRRLFGGENDERRPPEVDIQAALKIVGERPYQRCMHEMNLLVPLDLASSVLPNSNLNSLRLPFVDFGDSDLRFATLRHTDLRQAWLGWANFQFADFYRCVLHRAALRGADLRSTNVAQDALESAHGVKSGYGRTQLPDGMRPPSHWFAAPEAEKDSEELRDLYFSHYREFLDRDEESWMPGSGKHIKIDDVRLKK